MPADLFEEHRLMIATAEDLLTAVRRVPRQRLDEIAQIRVRLANLAVAHLRAEDKVIIKPLVSSGRQDEIPGAATLIAEVRKGHSAYSDHVRKWTLQAIETDREGYAQALVGMIDYLRNMTAREEHLLYWPTLRLLAAARPSEAG